MRYVTIDGVQNRLPYLGLPDGQMIVYFTDRFYILTGVENGKFLWLRCSQAITNGLASKDPWQERVVVKQSEAFPSHRQLNFWNYGESEVITFDLDGITYNCHAASVEEPSFLPFLPVSSAGGSETPMIVLNSQTEQIAFSASISSNPICCGVFADGADWKLSFEIVQTPSARVVRVDALDLQTVEEGIWSATGIRLGGYTYPAQYFVHI